MKPIKDRLRQLRQENGLTMAEFAKKISVSPGNVGDWESEYRPSIPGAKALISISQTFDVSLDWLLLGQLPPTASPCVCREQHAERLSENLPPSIWEKNSLQMANDQEPDLLHSLVSSASLLCKKDKLILVELAARLLQLDRQVAANSHPPS
ncbi:XRE family transcriptional regulator [Cohnella endophytica]|uniref:XRE family transcriptional regulator n=1 Tax=Cohnella endophytica TaxID=2419778 RepID=A0A494XGS3_9BACL|nr:helix-turn-helix transcriptional regulator [Cohnella endophytica]RKP47359.1 XRE family transcriptional regulator [Cohnella endophytica]